MVFLWNPTGKLFGFFQEGENQNVQGILNKSVSKFYGIGKPILWVFLSEPFDKFLAVSDCLFSG